MLSIAFIGHIQNQVKFINISTEQISQCNQSEPLADASGRMVDLMNENAVTGDIYCTPYCHINYS